MKQVLVADAGFRSPELRPLMFALGATNIAMPGRTASPHGATLDDFPMRSVDLTATPGRKTLITDVYQETTDDD